MYIVTFLTSLFFIGVASLLTMILLFSVFFWRVRLRTSDIPLLSEMEHLSFKEKLYYLKEKASSNINVIVLLSAWLVANVLLVFLILFFISLIKF